MFKTILHPTDLSESHFHMAEKAANLAKNMNAKLFLIHVIEPPTSLQLAQSLGFAEFDRPRKDDAKSVLKVLGEALDIPEEQQLVEVGSIKKHILEAASKIDCDLIIMGSHEPDAVPRILGSTAHAVVHSATCDVLTIRNKLSEQ